MNNSIFTTAVSRREANVRKQLPPIQLTPRHTGQIESVCPTFTHIHRVGITLEGTARAALVDILPPALNNVRLEPPDSPEQTVDRPGSENIVAVEEQYISAHRMQQPLVPRPRGAPASVQFKEGNVGKSAVTGEQLAGTVGRSVVYSNKLYTVSARLREHTVHMQRSPLRHRIPPPRRQSF